MSNQNQPLFTADDIVYVYTRTQAVEDGVQVKLEGNDAKLARQAGWVFPIYMTRTVWELIEKASNINGTYCDGVLWDVMWMSSRYAKQAAPGTSEILFQVIITGVGRKRNHVFKATVGATDIDDPRPAVTIMMVDED